jgi:hypothetical protein
MHRQASLGSVAFSQHPFSSFFAYEGGLAKELGRSLNLCPAAKRNVVELL